MEKDPSAIALGFIEEKSIRQPAFNRSIGAIEKHFCFDFHPVIFLISLSCFSVDNLLDPRNVFFSVVAFDIMFDLQ